MKNLFITILTLLILTAAMLTISIAASDEDQTTQTRTSSEGLFNVTITSSLNPLELGKMHSWTATILTADNTLVTDAEISISGGMPIHNHGFPTQPLMTQQIEDGVYLLEGFKFSMGGPWLIVLDINTDDQTDTVAFDIDM